MKFVPVEKSLECRVALEYIKCSKTTFLNANNTAHVHAQARARAHAYVNNDDNTLKIFLIGKNFTFVFNQP